MFRRFRFLFDIIKIFNHRIGTTRENNDKNINEIIMSEGRFLPVISHVYVLKHLGK